MSFVGVAPDLLIAAATDLANIGDALSAARAAAAAPTTRIVAAAQDEVSTAIAEVFAAGGQQFQDLGAQAATFHDQFVQALTGSGGAYAGAESAAAAAVQNPVGTLV
jgi:hypothetical protein